MAVARRIDNLLSGGSLIRKMFNQGQQLKERYGAENVYDLSIGNPDLSPPAEFYAAAEKILKEDIPGKHAYMNNAGLTSVREKIAKRVRREQGVNISGNGIIMTVGAGSALSLAFHCLVNPGDRVLVPAPAFVAYRNYLSVHGGRLEVVPGLPDFSINLEQLEQMIDANTAAVIINSPNNPSGTIYSEESLVELGKLLERLSTFHGRRIYLISDEPYREIIYRSEAVPPVFQAYPHSIICYSYSKSLSIPGERIGWAAVHPGAEESEKIVAGMTGATLNMGYTNAPALMQRIVAEIDGCTVDVERYRRRRDLLAKGLKDIGYEFELPPGAFYMFPKVPAPQPGSENQRDDMSFCERLVEEKILTVPGSGFAMPGYFRISYCVDERIIEASLPGFRRVFEQTVGST